MAEENEKKVVTLLHKHRCILVGERITDYGLDKAAEGLVRLDAESNEPILLIIKSKGGETFPALQFADVINALNSPVDALMMGDSASAAVDIMQMCRKRLLTPSARILVHYVRLQRLWVLDDAERLKTDIQYFEETSNELLERRYNLYEKRTGHSREKLAEMFRQGEVHQMYFSAHQAVNLKLADSIVSDFKFFPKEA